jgi:hypothetical protein
MSNDDSNDKQGDDDDDDWDELGDMSGGCCWRWDELGDMSGGCCWRWSVGVEYIDSKQKVGFVSTDNIAISR